MDSLESPSPIPLDELLDHRAARCLRTWVGDIAVMDAAEGYAGRLARVAGELVGSGADALSTSRAIATFNDELIQRFLQLAEASLGAPPCPYAWLVLGSEGRMEQALLTDQDNALAYAEPGPVADRYFARMGKLVVGGLLGAGFPHCPGGYMATNWCRSLAAWQRTFTTWIARPEPQELIEAEVFLDFRRVHGRLDLRGLDAILRGGSAQPRFLAMMARAAVTFAPPLRFTRLRTRGRQVDLKRGGLAAIVLLARLYAIAAGSGSRSTPARLADAAQASTISPAGADGLVEAYRLLADLRLHAQLRTVARGHAPDNLIALGELGKANRERLRRAFNAIRQRQRMAALQYHPDTVS